jgi:succinate dehydrogenase/fumarate reductase cytochrome b subunit
LNALILLFVGVAGKFKPEWLHAVAEALQSMPFVYFLGGYVIFLFVTAAIGIRILTG